VHYVTFTGYQNRLHAVKGKRGESYEPGVLRAPALCAKLKMTFGRRQRKAAGY